MRPASALIMLALMLGGGLATAQTALPPAPYANTQLPDPKQEAQAKALMETIRCLTCQSQSIADSGASMAADLRSQIRERIAAGERPEHIRAWLIQRYGDWISYKPKLDSATWPLWVTPLVLLVAGGALALGRFKRGKGRRA